MIEPIMGLLLFGFGLGGFTGGLWFAWEWYDVMDKDWG